jgi:hypothetical protein
MFNVRNICILLLGLVLIIAIFAMKKEEANDIVIIYKSKDNSSQNLSWFNDFFIDNNQVNIECIISFMNNTNTIKKVMIFGYFEEDVKGGLLKSDRLSGYYNDDIIIELVPGENKYLKIIFKGEYGGKNIKQNRNLPKRIEIKIIQ